MILPRALILSSPSHTSKSKGDQDDGEWIVYGVILGWLSFAAHASIADEEEATVSTDSVGHLHRGALADHRHRVLISTDLGGTDPDDFQPMVHFLLYADVFGLEGLVSSPCGPGRSADILNVIDAYASDYNHLKTHTETYPLPDALRDLTKQGETEVAPCSGVRRATEGSEWLVRCARRENARPLYVLVWGGIEDLAQALHDAPDILPKLQVYCIGGPNKKWSPDAYQYIADHHPGLWIIEANAIHRGWFVGGDQTGGAEEYGLCI